MITFTCVAIVVYIVLRLILFCALLYKIKKLLPHLKSFEQELKRELDELNRYKQILNEDEDEDDGEGWKKG